MLLFVSHDRHFVNQLATRIIELKSDGLVDFQGSYDEYIEREGDDHLDVDTVALQAKKEKKKGEEPKQSWAERKRQRNKKAQLPKRRDQILQKIESLEAERKVIVERYAEPTFYMDTPNQEIEALERKKTKLDRQIQDAMNEWEAVESEIASLADV
jgi:ATP-binding cassette subfamily F protein 3